MIGWDHPVPRPHRLFGVERWVEALHYVWAVDCARCCGTGNYWAPAVDMERRGEVGSFGYIAAAGSDHGEWWECYCDCVAGGFRAYEDGCPETASDFLGGAIAANLAEAYAP